MEKKLSLFGVRLDNICAEEADVFDDRTNIVAPALRGELKANKRNRLIVHLDVLKLLAAAGNKELRRIVNNAYLVVPGDKAIAWAVKLIHKKEINFLSEMKLLQYVLHFSSKQKLSFFLHGSTPKHLVQFRKKVKNYFPYISIKGMHEKTLRSGGEEALIEGIRKCAPDFLLSYTGFPKNIFWINENETRLNSRFYLPLDHAFAFFTGIRKTAPMIMQKMKLSWLFYLLLNPLRGFKIFPYFIFFIRTILSSLFGKNRSIEEENAGGADGN